MDCRYCDSAVEEHDPVYVTEGAVDVHESPRDSWANQNASRSGDADPMAFCNYACLTAFVDERGLADGACCNWSPE